MKIVFELDVTREKFGFENDEVVDTLFVFYSDFI